MMIKDIAGYEGLYKVTSEGDVYSVKRKKNLKPQKDKDGYYCVNLYDGSGKQKRFFIHRLVALAFIPNPEGKPTVNHLNECKTDNRLENLTWATMKEQNHHGSRMERAAASKRKPVRCVETGEVFESASAAAASVGAIRNCITYVCNGHAHTHRGYHWEYVEE